MTDNSNEPINAELVAQAEQSERDQAFKLLERKRLRDAQKQARYRARKKQTDADANPKWNDPNALSEKEILEIWRAKCSNWHPCMEGGVVNALWFAKEAGLVFNRFVAVWGVSEAIRARDAESRGETYTPRAWWKELKLPENQNA